MRKRKDILIDLIQNNKDTAELVNELSNYMWDCDEPLLIITANDIYNTLNKYILGAIDNNTIENWANAIECREDLEYESDFIQDIIIKLANPVLYGEITINNIAEIRNKLINVE